MSLVGSNKSYKILKLMEKTKSSNTDKFIKKASKLIKMGELVAMPTETVYGLAANAFNNEACMKIYKLKGRPSNNPLIIHVSKLQDALELANFNEDALKLASIWPGPLTMVLEKKIPSKLADCVSAGLSTIAIRIPAHDIALKFIEASGMPIAAPSANISGRMSPSDSSHVRSNFTEDDLYILEGDKCKYGLESTIIDLSSDTPVLLRYGFITPEYISSVLSKTVLIHKSLSSDHSLKDQFASADDTIIAPGMSYKHYSPRSALRLNASELYESELGLSFGDVDLEQKSYGSNNENKRLILNLSTSANLAEAASNLFDYLHRLDNFAILNSYDQIAVAPIPNYGIGLAINDRLRRAAEI